MFEDEITIPFALYSVNGQTNGIHMGRMAKVAIDYVAGSDTSVEEALQFSHQICANGIG